MVGGPGGHFIMMGRRELEKGRKLAPGTIRRAFGFTKPYRASIAGFLSIGVVSAFLGVTPALIVRSLIDTAIPQHRQDLVAKLALAGIGVAILLAVTGLLGRYLSARVGEGLIYDLRVTLFDHVQRLPIAFFTRTQTGALISRLNTDVVGAQGAVTNTLSTIQQSVTTLGVTLATMLALSWKITLLAMVVLPLFLLPSKRVGAKLSKLSREQMGLNAEMSSTMQERFNVSGAMVSKLFGRPDDERQTFGSKAGNVRDMGVKIAVYARTFFITLTVVAAVGSAVVYWLGGTLAIRGELTPGTLVAFTGLIANLYPPLMALTNARVDLMTSFVSFERVFEVLDLEPAIADAPDAVTLHKPQGRIEFRDVTFRYPKASEVSIASLEAAGVFADEAATGHVLKGVSFVAEPGATVALVGPSGAGKTTISSLIPRLYDVTDGAVLIDGADVRNLTQQSLRDAIGVVSQDPHLFHDTIRVNLRFARPEATDEDIVDACKGAQIYDLIASLPDGLETVVGERGYRLSGGEKQRLAIARVLLKQPAIIILDEATSHLDSESEVLIQRALDAALSNRTAIVIAHRLSTIVNADSILVVEAGRIRQRGSHDELIAEGGLYADLYHTQFSRAATPLA
jgi:ATP-binding cassette, subfamily B, bacterial